MDKYCLQEILVVFLMNGSYVSFHQKILFAHNIQEQIISVGEAHLQHLD